MDEKNKKPLFFPDNCPPAKDIFSGFGSNELFILMITTGIALIVILFLWNIYGEVVSLSVGFSMVALVFVLIRRNQQQESFVDQIIQIYKYHRAQKQFEYEYHDEFEV